MKKNNLFKPVAITILVYILFTWIVPIVYGLAKLDGDVSYQIGLVSVISVILETFSGFGSIILYILLVGGFYGLLKSTGVYEAIMEKLSSKTSGKEKCTLITIIVAIAVLASISGFDLGLLIIYPILIGLIVKMGYDKLVAVAATAGATLVGMYGATFAGTLYGANNLMLGLDRFDSIVPKIVLFVLGLAALIVMVILYANKNNLPAGEKKPAKKATKASAKKSIAKKTDKSGVSATPALIIMCLLFVLFFLGTTNWAGIFGANAEGLTIFDRFHATWTEKWTIGSFPILGKLFGGIEPLGTWFTLSRFQFYSVLLVIAMVIIKFLYKTKKEDAFEGFLDGIKSFIVPAMIAVLAYSVFVFVYHHPVINVVTQSLLNATKGFNVALSGLYIIINSIFYVDYYYFAYSLLYGMTSLYTDAKVLSILSIMFTSLYSLVMLIAPTSVLLLVTLSIADVKYTDWVKFIWKLVLVLFVIAFIVFSVMLLI